MRWHAEWFLEWHAEWFGFERDGSLVPAYGDNGVASLVLDLEEGYTVTHRWRTDITKFRAGNEQRRGRNDVDRPMYDGEALLLGTAGRDVRAKLAEFAALGSTFLLALPHEAISLRADAIGATVPVFADELALCDWAAPGQRVVVFVVDDEDETQAIGAVIQDAGADTIVLDKALGEVGVYGGGIMPLKHVLLDPEQTLPRHEGDVESWAIKAIGGVPLDYAPVLARLDLGTLHASLAGNVIIARLFGLLGNGIGVRLLTDPGNPAAGSLDETSVPNTIIINARGGTTTMEDVATLLETSGLGLLAEYDADYVIQDADAFIGAVLSGGSATGSVGRGAALTTYNGDGEERPVWHRELNVEGAIPDGAHALTQIIDMGGKPYSLGMSDQPDWLRTLAIRNGTRLDEQWLKLFVSTVRGNQQKFWVPTWRADIAYLEHVGAAVTIEDVDFAAWWPKKREHVQVEQADGTITYAKITAAPSNGDGTRTLTLSVALSASEVTRIGWLELCRFEDADEYETVHTSKGVSVTLTARCVP